MNAHLDFLLQLADTNLIWSHRLSEWCGHGPVLEEDIALANIGLDTLGQARMLYAHARTFDPDARSEDGFAYFRDASEFRNFTLAELPNGDYAHTIVRNLILSVYFKSLWAGLAASSDVGLRDIAAKAVKESRYHVRHAADWVARFGDSTQEARQRVEAALNELWLFVPELFENDAEIAELGGPIFGGNLHHLYSEWSREIHLILNEATLIVPTESKSPRHDKSRTHTEHLTQLLAEMQSLARAHPGATW